jgi:DNA-binding response OmpR family regulator
MAASEKNKLVLVVDDHPGVLKFIEIDLKLRGFNVVTARSGTEALEVVKTARPDIVLLDMIMPGLNGFQTLREIRTTTALPVIAFSASPANQDMALQLGASDFMHKPFDPDNMAARIMALLE